MKQTQLHRKPNSVTYETRDHYKGRMLFSEYQNNHVYEITADSAVLRYTIDVDGRMPSEGFWDREDLTEESNPILFIGRLK